MNWLFLNSLYYYYSTLSYHRFPTHTKITLSTVVHVGHWPNVGSRRLCDVVDRSNWAVVSCQLGSPKWNLNCVLTNVLQIILWCASSILECSGVFFQHPFIQSAKNTNVLNNMVQEALTIMAEESSRADANEVRNYGIDVSHCHALSS